MPMGVSWGTPAANQAKDSPTAQAIGSIFRASNPLERAAADAQILPLRMVWFPSASQAEKYARRAYPQAFASWQYAQGHSIQQQLQQSLPTPLKGLAAVGDLAQRLTQSSTWVRVGEFIAGGLLLYMGLNASLRGTAAGAATQSAKSTVKKTGRAVGKVAMPELRTAQATRRAKRVTSARERTRTAEMARRRAARNAAKAGNP